MTALTHPWPVWGKLLVDGSPADNVEVHVRDVTQDFSKTVYTNAYGEYVVTLTNEGAVHDGDTVRVTVVGWQSIYREATATEGESGSHLDFNKLTQANSDTVNLTEGRQSKSSKLLSEAVQGSDSKIRKTGRYFSHTLQLTEQRKAASSIFHSEQVNLADSKIFASSKTFSSQLSLGDSIIKQLTYHRVFQETLSGSDSFNRVWTIYKVLSHILQLSEVFSRDVDWLKSFEESLQLADSATRHLVYFRTEQETVQLQDQRGHIWSAKKKPEETIGLADGLSRVWSSHKTLTGAVQLADSRILAYSTTKQEQLNLADSVIRLAKKIFQDQIELTDSHKHSSWAVHKTLADTISLAHTTRKVNILYHLTSALTIEDLAPSIVHTIGSVTFSRTFEDTLSLSDSLSRDLGKVLSDSLSLADLTSHGNWASHKTVQDIVQLDDATSKFAQHLRRALTAETLYIYDNPPFGLPGRSITTGVRRRTLTETLQLTHSSPIFRLGIVRSDTLQLSDTWSRIWILYRTQTEALQLADLMGSDVFGPFQGDLALARLGTALELKRLLSSLDLKRLQAVLNLRQGEA